MICCIFAVLVFTGCGEDPSEPTSTEIVQKKIPVRKKVPPPPSGTGPLSAAKPSIGAEETQQPAEEKRDDASKGEGETSGDSDKIDQVIASVESPGGTEQSEDGKKAPSVVEKPVSDDTEASPAPVKAQIEPEPEAEESIPDTETVNEDEGVVRKSIEIPEPSEPKITDPSETEETEDKLAEAKPEKETVKETEKEPARAADADDIAEDDAQPEDESPGLGENTLAALIGSSAKEEAESEEYNPAGKIDPFEPLFKEEEPEKEEDEVVEEPEPGQTVKKKRRIPRTPLEKMDLEQLKLVGVIRAKSGNKALVEEASGKGYIITEGTYIGIHSGRVIDIMKDRIVVEEEYEDPYGKMISRTRELKIQRPPGEG